MDHEVHKWEVSRDGIVLREGVGKRPARNFEGSRWRTRKNSLVFTCFCNDLPLFEAECI